MNWTTLSKRIQRWMIVAFAGASTYQVAGCDQEVSNILTTGFSQASITLFSALIQAFFTGLNLPDGNVSVSAQAIFEHLPTFLT